MTSLLDAPCPGPLRPGGSARLGLGLGLVPEWGVRVRVRVGPEWGVRVGVSVTLRVEG